MTAVGWLSEAARRVTTVATLEEAIARALHDLAKAGIPAPPLLDPRDYRLPVARREDAS